ncbi:MAG: sigma-70 family RNA polymerase sigma factor [Actinobacteria bacterium]|nr:sigma-70 family RNA polymerase sigma factor [Actinomycetota bacterium]MBU1943058.1 sigma-70 family RNA polymerase sigma factor [Actinomycetota bacterium]MBU2687995.1 sigma-70 family RNA polymerase sigma factor [Actinomycetota bacterium]
MNGSGNPGSGQSAASIESVYARYNSQVIRFFLSKGLKPDAAEDLSQEVFFRLLRSRKPLVDEAYTHNLVFRIAQNLAIDYFRKNYGSVMELPGTEDDVSNGENPYLVSHISPEDILISSETSDDVQSVLSGLPSRSAEAIVLREIQGLSYREMASRLGISEKAAESLLHRARVQLKDSLAEAGDRRGGWWSGVIVGAAAMGKAVWRKAASTGRLVLGKAAGLAGGGATAGLGHAALTLALIVLMIGAIAGAAVLAGPGGGTTDSPGTRSAVSGRPMGFPGTETGGPGQNAAPDVEAEAVGDEGVAASSSSAVADDVRPGDLLGFAMGTTRGLLVDAGALVKDLTGRVAVILTAAIDPVLTAVGALGVPASVLGGLRGACELGIAGRVTDLLVAGGVGSSYMVENLVAPPASVAGTPAGPSEGTDTSKAQSPTVSTDTPAAPAQPAGEPPASTGPEQGGDEPPEGQAAAPAANTDPVSEVVQEVVDTITDVTDGLL